jgi:hypothetical protein
MRYSFATPRGWSRSPFPPPQRGVYLRAPVSTPSPEGASILLFDAVAPQGTLEEHLSILVKEGTEGAKVGKTGKPSPIRTTHYAGLAVTVTVSVTSGGRARDEIRVFALVDAGGDRLPIALVGGAKALPRHQEAWEGVLASIGPLEPAPGLYTRFTE